MSDNSRQQFFSTCDPLVDAGVEVVINVNQSLKNGSEKLKFDGPTAVKVRVEGPRLKIDPSDIVGVYPAPGSEESPDEFLPHIALARRTLPWERPGPIPNAPWMALILVKDSEIAAKPKRMVSFNPRVRVATGVNQPIIGLPQGVGGSLEDITVGALEARDKRTFDQFKNVLKLSNTTSIFAAFIPNKTLAAILPDDSDLAPLCSMKRTWPDGVITEAAAQDTPIVICNRLPDAGDGTTEIENHTALLVSMEGRQDLYEAGRFTNQSNATALIVLHHWSFKPSGEGDFEELMHAIGLKPNGGVLRFGNLTKASVGRGSLSGGFASVLDNDGFFLDPLEHEQAGDVSFRGPLRPFPAGSRKGGFAAYAAPEEFEDDPGQDDYSYAAAFELGRLMALGDAGILEEMRDIHSRPDRIPTKEWVNKMPPKLQWPDWVMNDDWHEQPWEMPGQQLIMNEAQQLTKHGLGDFTGLEKNGAAWKGNVLDPLTSGPATVLEQVFEIEVMNIDVLDLENIFVDVINAGQQP